MSKADNIEITFNDGNHKVKVTIAEENEKSTVNIDWSDCPDDYEAKMIGLVNWFVKTITTPNKH